MELDMAFFALSVPAVLFAAISKAGFGSGAAFVSSAILATALPPGLALALMLPLLMLIDVAALRSYWGLWDARSAIAIVLGAVPGVVLGAWLYLAVDADVFRVLIGAICLLFVAYQGARAAGMIKVRPARFRAPEAWAWGGMAGFTSFISHAGGPPVAVFLLGQQLSKSTFQATTVVIFWAINLLKLVPYVAIGVFSRDALIAALLLAPVALIGAWIGVRAHAWVSERLFFGLTYVLLTVTGARLIWIGLA